MLRRVRNPFGWGVWGAVVITILIFQSERLDALEPEKIMGVGTTCTTTSSCLRLLRIEGEDPAVRLNAVVTLGALEDPFAVPDLIGIVKSHRYGTRVYHYEDTPQSLLVVTAIRALGTIGDRRALPTLIEFIEKEPYIQYRVLAADMIRMIGIEQEDVPMLLGLLNDVHTSIRFIIFETIRFADDPVSRRYTRRFIHYVPRVDIIEDSVTTLVDDSSIGVAIYPEADYLFYASASDTWIMRDWPDRLNELHWLHTFFTPDSVDQVLAFYEARFRRSGRALGEGARRFSFGDAEDADKAFIGAAYGFVIRKNQVPTLKTPVLVVSIYEDKVLEGTAITFYAPKKG